MTVRVVTDRWGLEWLDRGIETDDRLGAGDHEDALIAIAESLIPEGGHFLDVGAHVGLYTLRLGRERAGLVMSIEANPLTYDVLKENVYHNADRINAEVRTANIAAWDEQAWVSLMDANDKASGGSTWAYADTGGKVLALPLDEVLPKDIGFHLVKIDVEGAEARVLRGMEKMVRNYGPTLFIEMHDEEYDKPEILTEVLEFLVSVDYEHNEPKTLRYGGQHYLIAKPRWAEVLPEIEVVKAGEN